ncbi:hypothetical protein [Ralstonia phage RP13]|nr:hypothetical protein [Ralstonia phage RP13]
MKKFFIFLLGLIIGGLVGTIASNLAIGFIANYRQME